MEDQQEVMYGLSNDTWVKLKVTFAVLNFCNFTKCVYTYIEKRTWLVILSKVKDFSRSQAVTYTGKVVISRAQC